MIYSIDIHNSVQDVEGVLNSAHGASPSIELTTVDSCSLDLHDAISRAIRAVDQVNQLCGGTMDKFEIRRDGYVDP